MRHSIRTSALCYAIFWAIPALAAAQTIWHVDDDNCPGPGSGTSSDPFCQIQYGINAASDGDTVLVRPGTYEAIDFMGKAIRVTSRRSTPETTIIDGADRLKTIHVSQDPLGLLWTLTGRRIP